MIPKKRDPFAPRTPGRKCEFCKRGGAVTRYMGYWSHPACFNKHKATLILPKPQAPQ